MEAELDHLVDAIAGSPKNRNVSVELIRRLGARELATRRNLKEAIKGTRSALHQAVGAYIEGRIPHDKWLLQLEHAKLEGPPALREACRQVMNHHASTRERLPALDRFYVETLGGLPPIRSVVDIGCGLNPLAIPWMPLADDATYFAYDACGDVCALIEGFLSLAGVRGHVSRCDVSAIPLDAEVDLGLFLKLLPILEQSDRGSALRLLRAIPARRLLVSFPTRSLGGRGKGMAQNYEAAFFSWIQREDWAVTRHEFTNELCFLVTKPHL